MTELAELMKLVTDFRDERDWKQFHNPKDVAISLVLEATELLEHYQWKSEEEIQKHLSTKREDVEDELADVFYWVLLIASDLDVDLAKVVKRKLVKNAAKYPVHKSKGRHTKYTEL